ncbi:uncharacterized protein LOC144169678 isoform X2 [Haemaphysalis longicornis]
MQRSEIPEASAPASAPGDFETVPPQPAEMLPVPVMYIEIGEEEEGEQQGGAEQGDEEVGGEEQEQQEEQEKQNRQEQAEEFEMPGASRSDEETLDTPTESGCDEATSLLRSIYEDVRAGEQEDEQSILQLQATMDSLSQHLQERCQQMQALADFVDGLEQEYSEYAQENEWED